MSIPVFADLDKSVKDIINDDYDCKNVLKIKTSGPFGLNFTTSTEHSADKTGKVNLGGKVSFKFASPGGFSVDKFEIKPNGAIVVETSLADVAPGLKFEFKGDDQYKGDLSAIYKTPIVTATAEVDVVNFSKIKSSIVTKTGPISLGANAALDNPGKAKLELGVLDLAASWSLPNNVFASVKTSKWLAEYNFALGYSAAKNVTIASLFTVSPAKGLTTLTLGGLYKCNPNTALKFKLNNGGIVAASVKQTLDKSASAVLAAEVDVAKVSDFKFGITTNLG